MEKKIHTKDFLAQELEKIGLTKMAEMARTGYYHDFLSPLDFPEMQLAQDFMQDYGELRAKLRTCQ